MNKTVFVVLAVCLISVQAFVKRDAPAEKPAAGDDFLSKFSDGTKELGSKISEAFKPDNIKKNFDEFTQSLSKTFENLKPKEQPKA